MKHENSLLCVKTSITAALGFLTALWGWFGWLVVLWAALMLADWLVGSAAAARGGLWSSAKAREGAWHKAGMTVTVCVALAADWLAGTLLGNLPLVELPFTYSVLLGPLVIVWYVIGELGSLAEHAVTMGAPVPAWLPRLLAVTRNAVNGAAETITGDNPGRD
ncbi:MAG: phage holin family protein [Oscillibacter sp.]|jgi:phage-related holin|nr:phage holin family protein [uncultured Oscillibacter sp.]MCI8812966.1 phage holin family protein [Oscillibacter sp.]